MATSFSPKDHKNRQQEEGVPAGDYSLALRSFTRKRSAKGVDYLRGRFEVVAGPGKGGVFFDAIGLDISNAGIAFRLSMLAELCGQTAAFDLDSDQECRAALCNRPFRARVKRSVDGQYINNGIERYIPADKYTESELQAMNTWLMEFEEKRDMHNGGGGGGDGYESNDSIPPPSDDDIPF